MTTLVLVGDGLGADGTPAGHPNAIDRQAVFWRAAQKQGIHERVRLGTPRVATRDELLRFHTAAHVDFVAERSRIGDGYLDDGDTPAYPGVYEAAATRVGTALDAVTAIMSGEVARAFQPAGGLHHARRDRAAGFCAFSDIGVVIETLRERHGVRRIAYVDIDAHHGDGVFYSYESDPELVFADIHEDGRFLYPGTGHAGETGKDGAAGTKLNIPLLPAAEDEDFFSAWERVEKHLESHRPEFFILQCGADGVAGDPLADLRLSPAVHAHATRRLVLLAEELAQGSLLVLGGGGYDAANVAAAWTGVLRELVGSND